jgi:hypothetical protein
MTRHSKGDRDKLLSIQRSMVFRLKNRMKRSVEQTPELVSYYAHYRREVTGFSVHSYPEELVQSIVEAQIAYVGDFHTLLPAQKFLVRLVDMVKSHPAMAQRPLVVALEAFHSAHQKHLEDYRSGTIGFPQLLERCAYRRNWGFPVGGYRRIVEACQAAAIPILGINSSPRGDNPLQRRDRHAAKIICRLMARRPDALVIVFIGDLHVATRHLPAQVTALATRQGADPSRVIVYSNPESIYWQLAQTGLEYMVNVVKVDRGRYAVLNATPLAKYESYLRFVEGVVDDRDWDPSGDANAITLDVEEQAGELYRRIVHYLGIHPLPLPDFELVTWDHKEETVGEMAMRYGALPQRRPAIVAALKARQTAFVGPYGVFLHQFSLNDAADLAGRLILRALGWKKPFERTRDAYFADIIYEGLVYFATKVINPKRTCKRKTDLERWVEREGQRGARGRSSPPLVTIVGRCVLPHLRALQRALATPEAMAMPVRRSWWQIPLHSRLQATRLLGSLLGERLFYSVQVGVPQAHIESGRTRFLTLAGVVALLRSPSNHETDSFSRYLEIWSNLADVTEHHRVRDDWF